MTAEMNIGISKTEREEIAAHLARLLADTYLLYLKTHNFHWNVTGPHFEPLHLLFEAQYTELAAAVDEIAERIRTLGAFAPGSFAKYLKLASIREEEGHPDATQMITQLMRDHETVAATARSLFPTASKAQDEATVELLTGRLRIHEKTAWMLRSHLS